MKPSEDGKRTPLNMRTTRQLRDRLAEAARVSGRSLAQEVEFRLEDSFRRHDIGAEIVEEIMRIEWNRRVA